MGPNQGSNLPDMHILGSEVLFDSVELIILSAQVLFNANQPKHSKHPIQCYLDHFGGQ